MNHTNDPVDTIEQISNADYKLISNEVLMEAAKTSMPTVFNILDSWHCKQDEQMAILGLSSRATLNKYRSAPNSAKVSKDFMERMSYVLNIHKCLRLLFTDDSSVYGWMKKPNHHPFFEGRSALEVVIQGRIQDLYNVATRLHAYRGGMS